MLYGRRPRDSRSRLSTVTILPEPTPHPALGRHVHLEMMLDLKWAAQVGTHSQHFGRAHSSPRAPADTKAFEQQELIFGAVSQVPSGYVFVAM
jgi:hypothetical protein